MPQAGKKTRAGSSRGQGSAAASRDPAVQKKIIKNSDHYAQTINRLDLVVAQQQDALRKARQQKLWEQERQKAIACQEELEHILAAQQELLTKHAATDPQLFSTVSAAAAASGENWGNSRLAAATLQHIMQVKGTTVEDWLQQSRATFPQLAVLLELANGSCRAGRRSQLLLVLVLLLLLLLPVVVVAAAMLAVPMLLLLHLPMALSGDNEWLAVYAAMYHNPQPYYHFAACYHATGELQMAPPSALQAVAQRMQLSPLQQQQQREGRAPAAQEADDDDPGATQTEAMRKQLDRYLRHINIHTVVTAVCIGNTLTTRQLATMTVASYPFAPNAHAVKHALRWTMEAASYVQSTNEPIGGRKVACPAED
ncbi:hypothetical protein OEZ86_005960 [Tetradesmus obliquus]|nr:hypothetical protein OEZ86_005960 [Tetradesmus obliquus]